MKHNEDAYARIGFELKDAIDKIAIKENLSVKDCSYLLLAIIMDQCIHVFGPKESVLFLVGEINHLLDLMDPLKPNTKLNKDMN